MSIRTHKRLAALVIALSLCLAAHPALSRTLSLSSGNTSSASLGDGRSGLKTLGDPDRGVGCTPPVQVSKTDGPDAVSSVTFQEWLAQWMAGLLQRIGYGY